MFAARTLETVSQWSRNVLHGLFYAALIITLVFIIIIFYQMVQKLQKVNFEICLIVHPTLAGRHQRNDREAKPN